MNLAARELAKAHRTEEWKKYFLRTLLLFWPLSLSKTSLLLLADEEHRGTAIDNDTHVTLQKLNSQIAGGARIAYNAPTPYYNDHGHDRQQLLMFYADNYTNAEYVGFVDTDCLFITYIDREDLFEHGRPVVNGRRGDPWKSSNGGAIGDGFWRIVANTTYAVLDVLETMRCMSYFPVIVKTKHLKKMREHMERVNGGMPFYEIFQKRISPFPYSQFNIMCTYLFEFHKDDYEWYVHDISPGWDGKDAVPGQNGNRSIFSDKMFEPKPRIAAHANYRNWGQPHWMGEENKNNLRETIQHGICFSPPYPQPFPVCHFLDKATESGSEFFEEMHMFEMFDWTTVSDKNIIKQMHAARNSRIRHCNHTWDPTELSEFMPSFFNEGDVLGSKETGKSLYLLKNGTLHQFQSWGTFVNMGYDTSNVKVASHRGFKAYAIGEPLPEKRLRQRLLF